MKLIYLEQQHICSLQWNIYVFST